MRDNAMNDTVYLDYNASTPIDPEVSEAMQPFLEAAYGNPSSSHWAGRPAREAVEQARAQVARFLGAQPQEIVFTSGGTESNNAAILGTWFARSGDRTRIVTSAIEHPATREPCRFLARLGAQVTVLPVDGTGQVAPADLEERLDTDVVLLTVMHANNEVGTIQRIDELAELACRAGAFVHTDAAQSAGKVPVDVRELGVDLLSVAGHKIYGPKGIGALYVRQGIPFEPFLHGAGHEGGRRSGTESALLAVGLGMACELAHHKMAENLRVQILRDRLWDMLREALGEEVILQGHPHERLPNTLNLAFRGRIGAEILARCPRLAASTGAACHSGRAELSDTLQAMGVDPTVGAGSIRLSLGRHTTEAEIQAAARMLIVACDRGPGG
jgi:cysteine desulfurase